MATGYSLHQNLTAMLGEIPADSILSRTVHNDEQIKVTLFGFAPGQELSEHTASVSAIIEILEGTAKVTLGEDRVEAEAGFWVHMPANLVHSVLAVSKVVMLLTMVKQSG